MRYLKQLVASVCLCICQVTHTANAGEIVVAHVGPFTGPLSVNGLANLAGSKACISEINAASGVNGNTLRLVQHDDEYKPEKTIQLMREVAKRDKPIAFLNLLGSANASALLKEDVLEDVKVPVVGVTPGADSLRSPGSRWMFHVHASDNAQLARIVQHLSTLGIQRIAVAYQDIPFGQGGLKFVESAAQKLGLTVSKSVAVPSAGEDFGPIAYELRSSNAQAYVMILVPNSGAAFASVVRGGGDLTPIYGMSYVPVKGLIDRTGPQNAIGIALAQVTPNTYSAASGLVRRFHLAMDKYAPKEKSHTQLHLIGYLNCRVMVEGLRNAGDNPTPERLRAALQKVRADLGGYFLDFGGGNVGSRYVDIGVVTRDAKLQY